jgi:hypothetical protein
MFLFSSVNRIYGKNVSTPVFVLYPYTSLKVTQNNAITLYKAAKKNILLQRLAKNGVITDAGKN